MANLTYETDEGKRVTMCEITTIGGKVQHIVVKVEQLCGACEGEGKFPVVLEDEQVLYKECEWCHGYGILCS